MTTDDDSREGPKPGGGEHTAGRGSAGSKSESFKSEGLTARRPEMTAGGGARDAADIANLLRSLNDELRDDGEGRRDGGRGDGGRSDGGRSAGRGTERGQGGFLGGGDVSGDLMDAGAVAPNLETAPSAFSPNGWIGDGRLTSTPVVVIAIIAALGIGGGVIWWGGDDGRQPPPPSLVVAAGGGAGVGDAPTPLISRTTSTTSPTATPQGTGAANPTLTPSPIIQPAPVQPTPVQSNSAEPPPRLLTPGQTTTVVRPPVDRGSSGLASSSSATVVVPPIEEPAPSPSPPVVSRAPVPKPSLAAKPHAAPPHAGLGGPTSTSASTSASSGRESGGFAVQVGTFSVAGNADTLVSRLSRAGWRAYELDWQDSKGRVWRVVRVGNFADDGAAKRAAATLRDKLSLSGQVIDIR